MNLIDNIKAINGGGIFEAYSEDALLLGGRVLKNEQDVGLTDRKVNYFYTRFDDRPLKIQKAEIQIKSCTPYEIASPKVLVLQFKEFDLNGIMYAALNVFNANYNRLRYEVDEVDIRKEIILKQETGEVKPMEGYRLVKISYTEYMPLDGCEDITCNGDVVIPITNDVKVYINSVLRYEPTCGTDLNLTLVDQDGASIDATYNGTEIVVSLPGDARVSNSDDSYDVNVASGGDLELPDEAITVNSAAFITKPSVKDQDIVLTDQDDNVLTPTSLSGNTIKLSTGWTRPTEWLTMPTIVDKVLYGLVLVFEDGQNEMRVEANNNRIEWDFENNGTIVTSNGSPQTYTYDYSSLSGAVSVYTEDGTNRNYKQVIFKAEQVGGFTSETTWELHNNMFADIRCSFDGLYPRIQIHKNPYLRIIECTNQGTTKTRCWNNLSYLNLEQFICPSPIYFYGSQNLFSVNYNLDNVIGGATFNYGRFKNINSTNCRINSTNASAIGNITIGNNGIDRFYSSTFEVTGTIACTATNVRRLFNNSTSKKLIFSSFPANPTSMNLTSSSRPFGGCTFLEELILPNCQSGFSIINCRMGATALDALFTSLGTASGTQTITITGNPGAATCDTTIATAKGFTIVI